MLERFNKAITTGKSIVTIIGWLGLTSWVTGVLAAVAGVVWAMITGIAAPIIIMAAFCTFTAAVYLAMAPMAFKILERSRDLPIKARPDPEIWRHVQRLELYQAACLLADTEPDYQLVQTPNDATAWMVALYDAVRSKEIDRIPTVYDDNHHFQDGYHPHESTTISRNELKKFAGQRHVVRAFLSD